MLQRLLEQLRLRGLTVKLGEGDTLYLSGPASEKTPEVLAACKAHKQELLLMLRRQQEKQKNAAAGGDDPFVQPTPVADMKASAWERCPRCQADVNPSQMSDPRDWQLLCGVMPTANSPGCPYRPRSS